MVSIEYAHISMLAGRLLFGAFFAFNGLNHFMKTDILADYTEKKGVPEARKMVLLTGLMLLLGGTSVVVGAYPLIGAVLIAGFLAVITPVMHDFWQHEEQERVEEFTNFMKNMGFIGGALVFMSFVLTGQELAFSLGLSIL